VLEIGSNTGFTTVQIARLTQAEVIGLDINDESIEKALMYAKEHGVEKCVEFMKASATDIPYEDESFDLVWASNVTSFIDDKEKAISEYMRVLKPNGFLVFVPIYYVNQPPENLVSKVGEAIGIELDIYKKNDWLDMLANTNVQSGVSVDLVYSRDYRYYDQEEKLSEYITLQLDKIENKVTEEVFKMVNEKYTYQIELFNENLKYAGYSTLILQKNKILEDPELFATYEV
jgi:ubiquinone/menaquinone biosynthesis C-methylase UbiE